MTIYVILSVLEDYYKKYGCYPEVYYVQMDGGAENANKYVVAALELLAIKRMSKTVFYTRLPKGHTHDDMDAIFGTIWTAILSYGSAHTFEQFKKSVEAAFSSEKTAATVMDITMVIPDYKKFLEPCIDKKLADLHKGEKTQLQWRFEAIDPSIWFPFGVKTTYRAYCSEKVVELVPKAKESCITPIGRMTGLEPTTVISSWYPAPTTIVNRPVEGMYILTDVPGTLGPMYHLDPQPFVDNTKEEMQKKRIAIQRFYIRVDYPAIRTEWDAWFEINMPTTNNSIQYVAERKVKGIPFHSPLKVMFLKRDFKATHAHWGITSTFKSLVDSTFQWPDIVVAAMPTVESRLDPNPYHNARLTAPSMVQLSDSMLQIQELLQSRFRLILNSPQTTLDMLKLILRRKVNHRGVINATGGKLAIKSLHKPTN